MGREARGQAPAVSPAAPARPKPSVLEELRANPRGYSFLQAVRLLRQAHAGKGVDEAERFLREQLRVRALLSLGFPPTDLTGIEDLPNERNAEGEGGGEPRRFRLTATFLGLYGPSSPLPTFYTEELLDEQSEDRSVSRDFLDVVGDGFFTLFFLAWTRHRLSLKVCEEADAATMERLYSLVGLGDPKVRSIFASPGMLLRAAGLLTQFPRSAAGLRGLLADHLSAPVRVVQCVSRTVRIPEDQRCVLGGDSSRLGHTAWLGSQARDDTGKIRIEIGPLSADEFRRGVPGDERHGALLRLVRFYCTEPLEFDLLLRLDPEEAEGAQLGSEKWGMLGCDTWLAAGKLENPEALFADRRRADPERQYTQTRSVAQ